MKSLNQICFNRTQAANVQLGRRHGANLVTLENRIFVFGGMNEESIDTDIVEEYHEDTDSWSTVVGKISRPKRHMHGVAVPASLFSHLPGGCKGIK